MLHRQQHAGNTSNKVLRDASQHTGDWPPVLEPQAGKPPRHSQAVNHAAERDLQRLSRLRQDVACSTLGGQGHILEHPVQKIEYNDYNKNTLKYTLFYNIMTKEYVLT